MRHDGGERVEQDCQAGDPCVCAPMSCRPVHADIIGHASPDFSPCADASRAQGDPVRESDLLMKTGALSFRQQSFNIRSRSEMGYSFVPVQFNLFGQGTRMAGKHHF